MGAPTLHVVSGTSPYVEGYAFAGLFGTKLSNPGTLPAGAANCIAQHPAEDYLAVGHATSPYVSVYGWDGAAYGSKVANPATLPAGTVNGASWAPDGSVLIVAHDSSPYVTAWAFAPASGLGTKYSDPVTALAGNANGIAFHPSGRWVAVATASSPYIEVYAWDSTTGFGAKCANPSTLPSSIAGDVAWSPDGRFLAVAHTLSPYVTVYEFDGRFGEKLSNPATLPTGHGQAVAFSPSGGHLAVAHETTPFVSVYPFGGGFGAKYSNAAVAIGATTLATSVSWSPDGEYLAVGHDTSPYVQVYPFVKHQNASVVATTTLKPAKPQPSTLPAGATTGVLFSSAGVGAGSRLANSYRLTRPSWELQAQFHRERYARSVLELQPASYLRFDDTSGSNAFESGSAGSTWTYTGGYTVGQGALLESEEGCSVDLNGSTGYIVGPDVFPFTGTASFTLMGMVNLDTIPASGSYMELCSNLKTDGSGAQGWEFRVFGAGRVELVRTLNGASDACQTAAGTGVLQGKTHHLAATYDGTNMRVYIDGVLAAGPTASSKSLVNVASALVNIGRLPSGANYLDGRLDEWSFWDGTALSAANVADLAAKALAFGTDLRPYVEGAISVRRGLSDDGRPLVGQISLELDNETGVFTPEELPYHQALVQLGASSLWRLNEASGTTAADTLNAVAGTYTGGYSLAEPSLLTSGEGRSVDLNGSTGYVPLASSSYNFAGRTAFTLVATVKLDTLANSGRLLTRLVSDGSGLQGYDWLVFSTGQVICRRWLNNANDSATSVRNLAAGETAVLAVTYDGQRMTVWVNGVPGTPTTSTKSLSTTSQAPYIGRLTFLASNYLDGRIQDVAVFDGKALSASEIADLYRRATTNNLYGLMMPYVPLRMRATEAVTGAVLPVFRGQVMRYANRFPPGGSPTASFEVESRLGHLQRTRPTVYTPSANTYTDDAIAAVLTAARLRTVDYDLDVESVSQIWNPHAPRYDVDALSQVAELAEGAGATVPSVFEGANGKVRYRSRQNILGIAGANGRWGDWSAVQPISAEYDARHDDRIGYVEVQNADGTNVIAGTNPVAFTYERGIVGGNPVLLLPGESLVIEARYEGPWVVSPYTLEPYACSSVVTPASTTDYTANTLATGLGTDRTSSLSVSFSDGGTGFRAVLSNTHASDSIYVTKFQVRADAAWEALSAVYRVEDQPFRSSEPSATLQHNALWHDSVIGTGGSLGPYGKVGAALLLIKRYAVPRLTLVFDWDSDAIQGAMLRAELLDLIAFEDRQLVLFSTAVRDWWRIESVSHEVFPGGNAAGGLSRSTVVLRPSYASAHIDTVVFDDFARANRLNTLGAPPHHFSADPSWTTSGGTWSIGNSAAVMDGTTARYAVLDTTAALAYANGLPGKDQMVKCTFTGLEHGGSTFVCGVVYRYTDASNLYRAQIDRANRQVQLVRRVAGTDTVVERVPWVPESSAELRVIVQGVRHRVYLNGSSLPCIDTIEDRGVMTGSSVGIYGENSISMGFVRFAAVGLN